MVYGLVGNLNYALLLELLGLACPKGNTSLRDVYLYGVDRAFEVVTIAVLYGGPLFVYIVALQKKLFAIGYTVFGLAVLNVCAVSMTTQQVLVWQCKTFAFLKVDFAAALWEIFSLFSWGAGVIGLLICFIWQLRPKAGQ
jgi:hypothetical protein